MSASDISEAEELVISLSKMKDQATDPSRASDSSSDEIEIIKELKVTLDDHQCDLCCKGSFLVGKLMQFGGLAHKYACEVCLKSFKRKSVALRHSMMHMKKDRGEASPVVEARSGVSLTELMNISNDNTKHSFSCHKCKMQYKTESGLEKHYARRHNFGDGTETCKGSPVVEASPVIEASLGIKASPVVKAQSGVSLTQSINLSNNKTPIMKYSFSCHKCTKQYKTELGLEKHYAKRHNFGVATENFAPTAVRNSPKGCLEFVCDICLERFKTEVGLKKHRENSHDAALELSSADITSSNNEIVVSEVIAKSFKNESNCVNTASLFCPKCQLKFKSETGLKRHNTNQHQATHSCSICSTIFKSAKMYVQHCYLNSCKPPTHSKLEKTISCLSCHKSFFFNKSFQEHVCSLDSE